jgi:hypothetical protein
MVTAIDYTLIFIGPKSIHEALVPITGWLASMSYSFTIFFAAALIYSPQLRWRGIRFAITGILFIGEVSQFCSYFLLARAIIPRTPIL